MLIVSTYKMMLNTPFPYNIVISTEQIPEVIDCFMTTPVSSFALTADAPKDHMILWMSESSWEKFKGIQFLAKGGINNGV